MRGFVLAVTAAAFLAACDSSTDPGITPPEWSAELEAADAFEGAGGTVEVVGGGASFTAAIELEGVAAGDYQWEIAAGSCEEPGNRVGAAASYTTLTANAAGEASADVTVTGVLQGSGTYHASVFVLDDEDERVPVACGDLERSN